MKRTRIRGWYVAAIFLVAALSAGCGRRDANARQAASGAVRPSILLVTLDTTRADAIGPEAAGITTPAFNAIAARGRRFRQAYAAVPETLPSHVSMMTGLYPAGHGVHENARYLSPTHPLIAERLKQAGYHTSAFVSSFVLARRFGLARGFDVYDDEAPAGRAERSAVETTDRAVAQLQGAPAGPLFLWVHYNDPHAPYEPPEPFRGEHRGHPYLGEVAAMDAQLGRLVEVFERQVKGPIAMVIAADHGEGLGEHGEAQHGALLYQATVHVPLALVGPGVTPGVSDTPVSTRRIYHTLLDWAGLQSTDSLRGVETEVVLAEAMKPFLEYGWQPQTMSVGGRRKAILAGKVEVYDVTTDPSEAHDLGAGAELPQPVRQALEEYPVPSPGEARAPDALSDDARQRLASLGYVGASSAPVVRKEAPRPADMTPLFELLDQASGLFVAERYADVIPLLRRILAADPYNLDATLRLATAHSALGQDAEALAAFAKAAALAPRSADVTTYLALHYASGKDWQRAVPLLERVVADTPERLPAVEALATLRERQGRIADAVALRQKVYAIRTPTGAELVRLGQLAMEAQLTPAAIESFERARSMQREAFGHDLELGVLYLAARRFDDARAALDRVAPSHPEYPMALFKRAQVSVLLNEPDRAARIERARQRADSTTRELIARERLFQERRTQ
ncbi:MAG: sulfatase-like hydrolase/transferase [Acidobacteriota bacterium]